MFISSRSLMHLAAVGFAATAAFGTPASLSAQPVDPDPEIFDGTRTKKDQTEQKTAQATDRWEDANLIIYDSDKTGSAEGGQGRAGGTTPGYAEGVQVNVGIPGLQLPTMGGSAGEGGGPGAMPIGGTPGIPTAQSQGMPAPGMMPGGPQSTPTPAGAPGQPAPGGKPGEVSIGDPSKKIAQSAQPVNKVRGGPPPPSGEEVQESKGEDTTTIPNAASGQQSNKRGGGVEKGDAMPTDI